MTENQEVKYADSDHENSAESENPTVKPVCIIFEVPHCWKPSILTLLFAEKEKDVEGVQSLSQGTHDMRSG